MSESDEAVVRRVQEVVARVLAVDATEVVPTKRIDQIAETDSLSLAEIASGLDDAFGIRIPTESLIQATTIADLVGVVSELAASRQA
jgi:acyl carrier protein